MLRNRFLLACFMLLPILGFAMDPRVTPERRYSILPESFKDSGLDIREVEELVAEVVREDLNYVTYKSLCPQDNYTHAFKDYQTQDRLAAIYGRSDPEGQKDHEMERLKHQSKMTVLAIIYPSIKCEKLIPNGVLIRHKSNDRLYFIGVKLEDSTCEQAK